MIRQIRNLSIKNKLLAIQMFSSLVGLFLASALLLIFQLTSFKQSSLEDLSTMAELIARYSTATLAFNDLDGAKENLKILTDIPSFQSACIYNDSEQLFAHFQLQTHSGEACPKQYNNETTHFEHVLLHVYEPVLLENKKIGTVYIYADLGAAYLTKIKYVGILVLVLFVATVITFLLTLPLTKVITSPLITLLSTINKIAKEKDFSLRAKKQNDDEIGKLVDGLNGMVAKVEYQNRLLIFAKDHYRALYDDNPTMVFNISAEGLIVSVNKFGAKQLDLTSDELQNRSIFDFIHRDDQLTAKILFDTCLASPQKVHKCELRKVCRDGRVIWARESVRLIEGENQQHNFLVVCEDVTEARELTEKVAYQASHDSLTGLANRSEFDAVLHQAVKDVKVDQTEYALCYLDLDQFKIINDTCGHMAGDELLRQLGDILKHQIRKEDILARLGGDEFGILMSHCSLTEAHHTCEKLRNIIKDFQFAWESRSFFVGVSIGITSINYSTGSAVEALKEADTACYVAKEKGRNRVHVFKPDDEELASRQGEMQWVEKIRKGLEENYFVLYGQLIIPVDGANEGLHFEALIRYKNKKGTVIPPGAFLPAAERYDMACELDKWVINHLFAWISRHSDEMDKLTLCSVNLSGLSLTDESMLDFIINAFKQYSIPNHKICFEITETAAIGNLNYATNFINKLREKGCLFSLDDFGSGLSSFAYLKNLPVDFLKIDGLFVKDIVNDKVDKAMVKSINEVGHVMGKKTIAEFVENEQILKCVTEMGINYVQGNGIAKPVPLDKLRW